MVKLVPDIRQLSPHFSYEEMTFSEMALRKGWDNEPNNEELNNLRYNADQLEKVRTLLGVPLIVLSGFRNFAVNRAVGGDPYSYHMRGLSADFKPLGLRLYEAAKRIEASPIEYDQLILENVVRGTQRGWIHLGFGSLARRESLTKPFGKKFYERGLLK